MVRVIFDKGGTATENSFPHATCWRVGSDGIEVSDDSVTPSVILAYFPHSGLIMIEKIVS